MPSYGRRRVRQRGTSERRPSGVSGVLSTRRWISAGTPRNIEAWAGTVIGGTIVRAVKQAAPDRASPIRFGIVLGVIARGVNPSTEITSIASAVLPAPQSPVQGPRGGDRLPPGRLALALGIDLGAARVAQLGVGALDRRRGGVDSGHRCCQFGLGLFELGFRLVDGALGVGDGVLESLLAKLVGGRRHDRRLVQA